MRRLILEHLGYWPIVSHVNGYGAFELRPKIRVQTPPTTSLFRQLRSSAIPNQRFSTAVLQLTVKWIVSNVLLVNMHLPIQKIRTECLAPYHAMLKCHRYSGKQNKHSSYHHETYFLMMKTNIE